MNGKLLFDAAAKAVETVTELPIDTIISGSRREDIVDARYILVKLLFSQGMYPCQISIRTRKPRRTIYTILEGYDQRSRSRRHLREMYAEATRLLCGK